ncbi:TetR/AcrR family transcriptional regulator [Streptomyces sp. NPDC058525]|uniref:TetR/AcrR family transcriptional regulator n=1 Tax=Streptomyces sp. NPDC058525 TaxID=3346538 RepID=UPI003661054A
MAVRSPLSRRRVLEAALRVVDEEGLDGLSMRRVATELGVETMALYRYTPSKNDLLDGLVESLFIELEQALDSAASASAASASAASASAASASADAASADAVADPRDEAAPPWREALLGIARAMYRVALAHPHVIPLVAVRPFTVPLARRPAAVLRAHERLLALLGTAGLDEETTLKMYRAFISWVLGYIVIELREVVDNPDEPDPAFRLGLHRLPVKDFPLLRSLGPALAVRGGEEQLAAGLDALLGRYLPDR